MSRHFESLLHSIQHTHPAPTTHVLTIELALCSLQDCTSEERARAQRTATRDGSAVVNARIMVKMDLQMHLSRCVASIAA